MTEMLQEYCDSRGVRVHVDSQGSVIRGVKILGLKSRNGRTYLPEALAQAARLYENAKVNVNHPKGDPAGPRDYQDRIGAIRNVVVRGGEGLFADFQFNPKHPLAEQLLWDAEHAPENVGFSHNVEARTVRRGDELVVEAITRVQSVDLVADPATTRGLFEADGVIGGTKTATLDEATQAALSVVTLEDLRRHRPELIEALSKEHEQEFAGLRAEIERLQLQAATQRKHETLRRLLREFELPEPESADSRDKAIVSRQFVETLLAAESEPTMRALVEERARLVRALGGAGARGHENDALPISRDQQLVDAVDPADVKSFVKAIS